MYLITVSYDISKVVVRFCHKIDHKIFCELTKRRNIILGPKIVVRLSYDRLWIGPQDFEEVPRLSCEVVVMVLLVIVILQLLSVEREQSLEGTLQSELYLHPVGKIYFSSVDNDCKCVVYAFYVSVRDVSCVSCRERQIMWTSVITQKPSASQVGWAVSWCG